MLKAGVMSRKLLMMLMVFYRVKLSETASETVLHAAIMGHKGRVDTDDFNAIAEALQTADQESNYCRIQFTALEYDTSNGSSVYESLKHARTTFENENIAVALGPQIDVFTSTDYVILHQIHFVTSSDEVLEQTDRTMSILPDPKSLSKAIGKIVKFFGWHKVAFLSQDDFSPVLALGGEGIFVSPIRLPSEILSGDDSQLQQTLTTLRESSMDKFILHSMKKDVVETVIKAAKKLHLLHHSISWFITYLDFDDIIEQTTIAGQAQVYGLQLLKTESYPKAIHHIFNNSIARLQQGLMYDVVGILHHYLKMHVQECNVEPADNSSMTADDFKTLIRNTVNPFGGALGEYIWPKLSLSETSNIRKDYAIPIYRFVDTQTRQRYAQVVFGKKETSIVPFMVAGSPNVVGSLKGMTFDIIAKQDEPFVMRRGQHADGTAKYEGFCVDVLYELSQRLGKFKYNIFELPETSVQSNGKGRVWDEIIHQLKVGNASIAIGAFAVTADREAKISFSYTIISSAVSMLLKRPPGTVNYFQFLGPFSTKLWIMIVVFFAVVGLGLYFMSRFDSTQEGSEQKFDLKESMWYSLTVLLQGSTEYSPQTTSMRTIVAFFWFCTLVINAAYTANLAAFLTLQQIDNRIKSVDHLARQTTVKYGLLNNSDLMHFFQNSRDDPYERMWTYMKLYEESSLLGDRERGLQKVKQGNYAYLDDGVINNYITQQNCEVESIEQNFGIKHFSMGFPKGAPYRGDINHALLALKEDGTLDRLRNKWWVESSKCKVKTSRTSTKTNTASELDISNMFGVFIVLIAFTVLAILYEIGHVIWKCSRERKLKQLEKAATDDNKPVETNSIQFGFTKGETTEIDNSK